MREWKPTNGNRPIAVSDFDRIVIPPNILVAPRDAASDNKQSGGVTGGERRLGPRHLSTLDPRDTTGHHAPGATDPDPTFDDGSAGGTSFSHMRGQRARGGALFPDSLLSTR